jgi:serine/threonine-protein kinase HipA
MAGVKTLAVWVNQRRSGLLAREQHRRYVFSYGPDTDLVNQVSLTMPVRLESWVSEGLHPVFQMNLPEGALLEAIRRSIAKVIGDDDLTILRVTGGNQVGKNRFALPEDDAPTISERPESLDELLTYPDTRELFAELVNRFALRSGISGVQPKVMLEASERGCLAASGYIVKSWGADYPCLGANEYFCMTAAKCAGLPTPEFFLSNNGGLFIMRRFDVTAGGDQLGFEDMCSLQGRDTAQKYAGSYERVAGSISSIVSGRNLTAAREQFFAAIVLSTILRNGDAHLKNFGVLYDAPAGTIELAPVYDIVTTAAYIKNDVPALTLAGTKKWWPRKLMERFAIAHLSLPTKTISDIFDRTAEAVAQTRRQIPEYIADHPEFRQIGTRMMDLWDEGVAGLMKGVTLEM